MSAFAVGAVECSNSEEQAFKLFPTMRNVVMFRSLARSSRSTRFPFYRPRLSYVRIHNEPMKSNLAIFRACLYFLVYGLLVVSFEDQVCGCRQACAPHRIHARRTRIDARRTRIGTACGAAISKRWVESLYPGELVESSQRAVPHALHNSIYN